MTRLVGVLLVIAGFALALPQLFTPMPAQVLVAAGIVLATIGGVLLIEGAPDNRQEDEGWPR